MPRPLHHLSLRHVTLASLALVALLASSCARQLPTAAATSPTRTTGSLQHGGDDNVDNQVVVTLAAGTDAQVIANDYGATLLDYDAANSLAVYRPGGSQTAAELVALMATDVRLTTSESNGRIIPAEARQKSFAFDDGQGSFQNAVEQPAAAAIGLPAAHRISTGGGVKVAILDTGIDPSHPMFAGRIGDSAELLNPAKTAAVDRADGIENENKDAIEEKSNEIPALQPLLQSLALPPGTLITADAMHCQQEGARFITQELDGDYLFGLKGNQEGIEKRAEALVGQRNFTLG